MVTLSGVLWFQRVVCCVVGEVVVTTARLTVDGSLVNIMKLSIGVWVCSDNLDLGVTE